MTIAAHYNDGLSAIWLNLLHIEQMKDNTVNLFGQLMRPSGGQKLWDIFLAATTREEGWDEPVNVRVLGDVSTYKI